MKNTQIAFQAASDGRLDKVLSDHLKTLPDTIEASRSQLQKAISEGGVSVNGRLVAHTGFAVEAGMNITFTPPGAASTTLTPFETDFEINFKNER